MIVIVFVLGLLLGSFVNALVWRLHEQATNKKDSKKLSIVNGRSMCVHCKHELHAFDLIPVLSWVFLKGRCRYCKKSISWQYPLVELLAAFLLSVSYLMWPHLLTGAFQYTTFAVWTVMLVIWLALGAYDLKWMLLPNRLMYPLFVVSAAFLLFYAFTSPGSWPGDLIVGGLLGSLGFGGFFYSMYMVSRGKWIGGGDVRLGFALGLILGWQQSLLALTLAAYLGSFVILVLVIIKKYRRNMKLPFGPFLLIAAYTSFLWGPTVIDWYKTLSGL